MIYDFAFGVEKDEALRRSKRLASPRQPMIIMMMMKKGFALFIVLSSLMLGADGQFRNYTTQCNAFF